MQMVIWRKSGKKDVRRVTLDQLEQVKAEWLSILDSPPHDPFYDQAYRVVIHDVASVGTWDTDKVRGIIK